MSSSRKEWSFSPDQLANFSSNSYRNKRIQLTNIATGEVLTYPSMTKAAEFLGVSRPTIKNCLDKNLSYNGYDFNLVNLEGKDSTEFLNKPQAIILTNVNDSSIIKEFPTIKEAAEFLEVSRSSLNYVLNNPNHIEGTLPTISGYFVSRTENNVDYIKPNRMVIEVINLESNTTNIYPSITLAAEALGVAKGSISMYFKNKQTVPFKNKYTLRKI